LTILKEENMAENKHPEQPDRQPCQHYEEDEIALIDLLRVLWKWKGFIIAGTAICVIAIVAVTMVLYPAKDVTECIISLNFAGIEEHRNPDKTLFDKRQIIAPALITKASAFLQAKDRDLPEHGIRELLSIEAVIPPDVQEKMELAEKKKETFVFFPNHFALRLTLARKGLFSIQERNRLLLSIVDEYRKDFDEKYGKEPLVTINFPEDFLAKSDYSDVINTFKARTDNFMKFLDSRIEKAGFFRSKQTGDSFTDIKDDLRLLSDINIAESEATINTLKLTKNENNLINLYKHKIRTLDTLRKKKEGEALIARKLFREAKQMERTAPLTSKGDGGEKGQTSLVLETSFIKELIKEDSSTLLLKTALESEIEANKLAVEIQFFEEEIGFLREKEYQQGQKQETIAHLQSNLKAIADTIVLLSQRANELNEEYLTTLIDNAVQVLRDPETDTKRSKSLKKITLLTGVAALFIFVFLAFFIEYIRNAARESN